MFYFKLVEVDKDILRPVEIAQILYLLNHKAV